MKNRLWRLITIPTVVLSAAYGCGGSEQVLLPLGPETVIFEGHGNHLNNFCHPAPGCEGSTLAATGPLRTLVFFADTHGGRFTGSSADLASYQASKLSDWGPSVNGYWQETSYGTVDAEFEAYDRVVPLSGAFLDYFNRSYVPASLTTRGLSLPATLDGQTGAAIHLRFPSTDAGSPDFFGDVVVDLIPAAGTYSLGNLVSECQELFDDATDLPDNAVTCSGAVGSGELMLVLDDRLVVDGSFIKVDKLVDPGGNNELGFAGPLEVPGPDVQVRLVGLPVPGGFPLTLTGTESVTIEVRQGFRDAPTTRSYKITLPAATFDTPQELVEDVFVPVLGDDLGWVAFLDAGNNRIGLGFAGVPGDNASIRVVGGTNHGALGLAGPTRVDGRVIKGKGKTVRGDRARLVSEVLSSYAEKQAQQEGLNLTCGQDEAALDALLAPKLATFASMMVVFIDDLDGDNVSDITLGRRAGASPSAEFQIRIAAGASACPLYTYGFDLAAGFMIGGGYAESSTWAHELGHTLGFVDLYKQPNHVNLDDFDYVEDYGLMDSHTHSPHVVAWHKLRKKEPRWVPEDAVEAIGPPEGGITITDVFTLAPIEHPFADFAGVGQAGAQLRQVLKLPLSETHWLGVELRKRGVTYSEFLPRETDGDSDPALGGARGGLLVTDTCDDKNLCLETPRVITLNPDGLTTPDSKNALPLAPGDVLDLATTTPAYGGIVIRDLGSVEAPGNLPDARRVEVEWGPGDFLELEIRPWLAPVIYGSPDIWIDWSGNGTENYPDGDPPIGNGDAPHVFVDNRVKVRVHNRGNVDAENVVTELLINTPMGIGDLGEFEFYEKSNAKDIPAGEFRNFVFTWKPLSDQHTCLMARIVSDETDFGDFDLDNNAAQENVFVFEGVSGSPYEPIELPILVNSDFAIPVEVALEPSGLPVGMSVELERRHLLLGPDHDTTVKARIRMDENVIDPDQAIAHPGDQTYDINVHGFLETEDSALPFGGVTLRVHPGRKSALEILKLERKGLDVDADGIVDVEEVSEDVVLSGRLTGPSNAFQEVHAALVSPFGAEFGGVAQTSPDGEFAVTFQGYSASKGEAIVYYFGPNMAGSRLGPQTVSVEQE